MHTVDDSPMGRWSLSRDLISPFTLFGRQALNKIENSKYKNHQEGARVLLGYPKILSARGRLEYVAALFKNLTRSLMPLNSHGVETQLVPQR